MPADWDKLRAEFPALADWTFLNTATFGQLPRRAAEAMAAHLRHRNELACADFLSWFDDADRIRELTARLIHSAAGDVAFIPNASVALSLLIGGMKWESGDRIVTLEGEFPNNIYYPALLSCEQVEFVAARWANFYESLTPRTRLVAVSTVNYSNGFRVPLAEVAAELRSRGILLYVDGTQSLGALRFDVTEIRPDMLAVHGYKWLLSPTGAGFVYVSPELRERLEPNVIGWRSHKGWRNVDHLHQGAPEFVEAAEKYEGGMLVFPVLYAMGAAIEMLLEIGPARIEQRVLELAEACRKRLRNLGARLPSDESPYFNSPIVAARFEGRDASQLARSLKERRILVSARHGNVRISTHFYNNEQDLDRLAEALSF
jgi:selenocysteine lyase/cysteine desulfurase